MRTWLSNVNPCFQQNPSRYWIFNMQGIENGGPFLMVDSVTKRYKLPSGYEVEALGGISLELRKGEMLGLFGPNGGGEDHACKHHYWPYLS